MEIVDIVTIVARIPGDVSGICQDRKESASIGGQAFDLLCLYSFAEFVGISVDVGSRVSNSDRCADVSGLQSRVPPDWGLIGTTSSVLRAANPVAVIAAR